jgi:hypothetical protein
MSGVRLPTTWPRDDRGMGRPTLYNDALADRLCLEIAVGRSMREICEQEDWAPGLRTVADWLQRDVKGQGPETFRIKYARARDTQADLDADDIRYIADHTQEGEIEVERNTPEGLTTEVKRADMIEHRKLRIGARQWTAEKLKPKAYGTRQMIEHSGSVHVALTNATDDELVGEIIELLATGRLKLPAGIQLVDEEEPTDDGDDPYGVG